MRSPEVCPNCGAEVPAGARACPECGSCEETGWSDNAHADGLDLPDESFNYEEFVEREFQPARRFKPAGLHWAWWILGLVLLAAMIFLAVR